MILTILIVLTVDISEEKVLYMMENIAPAVLNGGFSTLLAMSLLVTAKSHVAMSFFKIFFMICIFGLFHGLILLPTVLCMIGPSDEDMMRQNSKKKPHENGHGANGKVAPSDQFLKEKEQNIENENAELKVPLHSDDETDGVGHVMNEHFTQVRETNIV